MLLGVLGAAWVVGSANFDGIWSGPLEVRSGAQIVDRGEMWLYLRSDGKQIFASAGSGPNDLAPIQHVVESGPNIRFDLPLPDGTTLAFRLDRKGDQLQGGASGQLRGASVTMVTHLNPAKTPVLYAQVDALDKKLFDAFDHRDLRLVKTLFATDLEFYHDKDGLTNYRQNIDAFRRHFSEPAHIRRELDPESLEVHPLKGYGAVETGVHRFYTTQENGVEKLTATAKFMHVWRYRNGSWQIARVVSYDHR